VGEARFWVSSPLGRTVLNCFFGPLGPPPSSTAGPGDFGEHCLSAKRELRSRPVRRAAQGTRSVAKGGGQGRLSLVPFFSRLKKGTSSSGYPRHPNIRCAWRTLQNHESNPDEIKWNPGHLAEWRDDCRAGNFPTHAPCRALPDYATPHPGYQLDDVADKLAQGGCRTGCFFNAAGNAKLRPISR
jgi:hypothetical protein